jgi:hypothetical protein
MNPAVFIILIIFIVSSIKLLAIIYVKRTYYKIARKLHSTIFLSFTPIQYL